MHGAVGSARTVPNLFGCDTDAIDSTWVTEGSTQGQPDGVDTAPTLCKVQI